jgi:hypothetical protein
MARLKFRPDEPVLFEQMDLALELVLRFHHSVEYYRLRAEEACRPGTLTEGPRSKGQACPPYDPTTGRPGSCPLTVKTVPRR